MTTVEATLDLHTTTDLEALIPTTTLMTATHLLAECTLYEKAQYEQSRGVLHLAIDDDECHSLRKPPNMRAMKSRSVVEGPKSGTTRRRHRRL